MNKKQIKPSIFPFVDDPKHIYSQLIDSEHHSINLGWSTFTFEVHEDLYCGEIKTDGISEFSEKKIKLEMCLDDSTARETIIHELFHCMLEGTGMDENNFDTRTLTITNEALVVILTRQQLTLHNLNPGLYPLIFNDIQTTTKRKRTCRPKLG